VSWNDDKLRERLYGDNGPDPVRVAVVGVGYWGPNLVRNLYELRGAEVVWACDLRTKALAALARRYPAVPWTTRFDQVLEDPAVEAVVVATPVSTHYELALAALAAGKHVFVEKPIAGSSAEARELLDNSVVTSGMIPKVEAGLRAAACGVPTAIADGRRPGALRDLLAAAPADEAAAQLNATVIG